MKKGNGAWMTEKENGARVTEKRKRSMSGRRKKTEHE